MTPHQEAARAAHGLACVGNWEEVAHRPDE